MSTQRRLTAPEFVCQFRVETLSDATIRQAGSRWTSVTDEAERSGF